MSRKAGPPLIVITLKDWAKDFFPENVDALVDDIVDVELIEDDEAINLGG